MSMTSLLKAVERFNAKQKAHNEKQNLESVKILRENADKTATYVLAQGVDVDVKHEYFRYSFVSREKFEKINLIYEDRFKELPEPEPYHGFWKYEFKTFFKVKNIITETKILDLLNCRIIPRDEGVI